MANRVFDIIRENWDSGDTFGSAMMAAGDICDFLTIIHEGHMVPHEMGYVPAGLPNEQELRDIVSGEADYSNTYNDDYYQNSTLKDIASAYWNIGMVDEWEPFSVDDLIRAAYILHRVIEVCKANGMDY